MGFCVVPLLYQAYVRIQSEQFTLLATNLGSPQRDNLTCSDFGCSFAQNRQGTDALIFLINGSGVSVWFYYSGMQIRKYNHTICPTGKEYGFNAKILLHFFRFSKIMALNWQGTAAPNF